jgi:uncharacterized protein
MADLTPRVAVGAPVIQSYSAEGFIVGGKQYNCAVLIAGSDVVPLQLEGLSALTEAHLEALSAHEVTYLILGTGTHSALPPRAVSAALKARNIVIEPMGTAAACRTYNVLLAEGRQIAALLLPV